MKNKTKQRFYQFFKANVERDRTREWMKENGRKWTKDRENKAGDWNFCHNHCQQQF